MRVCAPGKKDDVDSASFTSRLEHRAFLKVFVHSARIHGGNLPAHPRSDHSPPHLISCLLPLFFLRVLVVNRYVCIVIITLSEQFFEERCLDVPALFFVACFLIQKK
jgi:hypothetical protein